MKERWYPFLISPHSRGNEKSHFENFIELARLCYNTVFTHHTSLWQRILGSFRVAWFSTVESRRARRALHRCLICGAKTSSFYQLEMLPLGHEDLDFSPMPSPTPNSNSIDYNPALFAFCERGHYYLHTHEVSKFKLDDSSPSLYMRDPETGKLVRVKYVLIPGIGGPSTTHIERNVIKDLRAKFAKRPDESADHTIQ